MNCLNRIDVSNEALCCGCMACAAVCPREAITMAENDKGFIIPSIDESKCVNCGLCLEKCDFKKNHESQSNIQKAYSLIVKEKAVLKQSTSGGAFTVLSDVVLKEGGYVVGSVMETDFTVHHVVTNSVGCRDEMRGSKYVQSDTHEVFRPIKDLLLQGKTVLFTGVPCQCAALKSFLGKDFDNLIVVDLLCHGVPNNRLFKEHVSFLEKQYNSRILKYYFRDKHYGWDSYANVVELENKRVKSRWINQVYYSFFVKSVSLRPSCFNCVYRNYHRPADITIGDFWGYDKISGTKNNTGVSLVLSHDEKGEHLIERCKERANVKEIDIEKIKKNVQVKPTTSRLDTVKFWQRHKKGGYPALVDNYFDNSIFKKMRFIIRNTVKRIM